MSSLLSRTPSIARSAAGLTFWLGGSRLASSTGPGRAQASLWRHHPRGDQQQRQRGASPASAAVQMSSGTQQAPGATWDGSVGQAELMLKDTCVLVDERDAVLGAASKRDAHRFNEPGQPSGLLHRAFSVFLFNSAGQLLLQQRAGDKITFPGVWTNTCCSHPLHGQAPDEADGPEAVASGQVPGAKAAAVRKLGHELGIPAAQVPAGGFRFLTRLHYCAEDAGTYGPGAPWGEHEMDYILFIRADVDVSPNPEEVSSTAWVDLAGLRRMMDPASGLKWSPWFRIIAERWLEGWWADLDETLGSDRHVDLKTIYKIM